MPFTPGVLRISATYALGFSVAWSLLGCPHLLDDTYPSAPTPSGDSGTEQMPPRLPGSASADASGGIAAGGGSENLIHRYSFDATGSSATDLIGSAPGQLINGTLAGNGVLDLAGNDTEQYLDLPNGIVSGLNDATFEAWLSWRGGDPWQRIFEFGITSGGEDLSGDGVSYLFLTPMSSLVNGSTLRAAYSVSGYREDTHVDAPTALPVDMVTHVAVVIDDGKDQMSIFTDGEQRSSVPFTGSLSAIDDVNNWLGRSQFGDAPLSAELLEFRIYAAALTQPQLRATFRAGPEVLPTGE